jgi:hypothetical protein
MSIMVLGCMWTKIVGLQFRLPHLCKDICNGYASARTSGRTRASRRSHMLMRLAPPLAFFGTCASSCYCLAPCLLLSAACERERERSAHSPMQEREHSLRASMQERPSCMRERERGITTHVPQCEREHSARAPMLEREGAQRACTCIEPAACSTVGDHTWWCRGTWCSACLPRESECVGSRTCCNILKQGETIETYVCNICI